MRNGGSGALIMLAESAGAPVVVRHQMSKPAGKYCSTFNAEMVAIYAAIDWVQDNDATLSPGAEIRICTDSQSAVRALQGGPNRQKTWTGASIMAHHESNVPKQVRPLYHPVGPKPPRTRRQRTRRRTGQFWDQTVPTKGPPRHEYRQGGCKAALRGRQEARAESSCGNPAMLRPSSSHLKGRPGFRGGNGLSSMNSK